MQQGPFAPRALPRFNATTDPAATVSSSTVFPGPPVMRSTLLRRFLDGTRTASPVAWHVLVTVLSLPPRHRDVPHQIVWRHILLPSSDTRKLGLWGLFFCRGHLWVHLCYGPVTRSPSSRWLCQSASSARFLHERDSSYRALTFSPVGLSPTEHASLRWTHSCPKTQTRCQALDGCALHDSDR